MVSLLEVADRAYTGLRMDEKEWNMSLFRKNQELIKRYNLGYSGPDRFFDVDNEEADRYFEAGVKLLSELGVYCIGTNRVIRFTEDEVLDAARTAPKEIIVGQGADTRVIRKRALEDTKLANFHVGGHCPWPQGLAPKMMSAFASVRRNDYIEGFNVTEIDGYEPRGEAIAAYANRRTIEIMREAVRKAGRPGMAIALYPTLTLAGCMLAPLDPESGLRRSDGELLSTQRDLKVEENLIHTALIHERYGGFRVNGGASSVIGGFCGPLEGAMVETIAKGVAAWMCYRDHFQYGPYVFSHDELVSGSGHSFRVKATGPPPNWVSYVIARAWQRNTNLIMFGSGLHGERGAGGEGSETNLLAEAQDTMASTVMGSNVGGGFTPYHAEWAVQVSDATVKARIRREEVKGLWEKLNTIIREKRPEEKVPEGYAFVGDRRMTVYRGDFDSYIRPMEALYDFERLMPKDVLVKNVRMASAVLKDLGINVEAAVQD